MGIFINMSISKSVTKQEWEKVYEESLKLVKAFPLAERRKVNCRGIDTYCLVPSVEREQVYGWNNEIKTMGWFADGDYKTLHTAEKYSLCRDMVTDDTYDADAGDALLGILPICLDYEWDDSKCSHIYNVWGAKTQGEPYHMYLLAIACLVETRLGKNAFVYGDITRGQCRAAVELANKYLDNPIDIPDRCDMERFYNRVSRLQLSRKEQFIVFDRFYLGTKDSEYGEYIRSKYTEEMFDEYWRKKFENCRIGTVGFDNVLNEYLLWGFELRKLCRLVNYYNEDNVPQCDKFVKRIMDAKLHLEVKRCEDALRINQEETEPYSIYTLMAQFAFAGARNKKVDRYIPIEDIKKILNEELGDKCEVLDIIEDYLQKEEQEINISKLESDADLEERCEQDASEAFNQMMDMQIQNLKDIEEKYDISTHEDLMYYKDGDKIEPSLLESLKKSFAFYDGITEEDVYKELMEKPARARCEWLEENNRAILIRDRDWNKIYTDIEENEKSFSRYYPMMRLVVNSSELLYLIVAIVLNDDLYNFCKK